MNIASIDIGTNTVLLLVCSIQPGSDKIFTIVNEYQIPRLGRGLVKGYPIPDENVERFFKVMENYKKIIDKNKCEKIIINATNAMRIATNSNEIVKETRNKFGYEIEVIPGEREAYLSFLGASTSLPNIDKKIVIDVGGGSTEIIIGNNTKMEFRKSFPIGAVSLTEQFVDNDPPPDTSVKEMKENVRSIFSDLKLEMFSNKPIIGVAGTPTTLSCMKQNLKSYEEQFVEGSILTKEDYENFISILSSQKCDYIINNYGSIVKGREDVLLAGSIILNELMNLMHCSNMYVSGRGLRYGAVVDFIRSKNMS